MLLKNFKVDNLDVQVYDTRDSMGEGAAAEAVAYLKQILAEKDEIYMIFAAAPSQNEFLAAVAEAEGIVAGHCSPIGPVTIALTASALVAAGTTQKRRSALKSVGHVSVSAYSGTSSS